MSTPASDLYLSPTQQDLLIAALNSNRPDSAVDATMASARQVKNERNGSAPTVTTPNPRRSSAFKDSPPTEVTANEDESYNFDNSELFGDLHDESPEAEEDAYTHLHDKRKSIDDEDDDVDEGGGKRQEGEDKTVKKPGRKPLTSEPTTKRKAQNRAAQRAFRERKEKHLKDLETKVDDLEKASEATNNENSVLKAQIERLTVELNEYRSRVSWVNAQGPARRQSSAIPSVVPSRNAAYNPGTSDFQFQFPKFGTTSFAGMFPATTPSSSQDERQLQATQTGQTSSTTSTMNTTSPTTRMRPLSRDLVSANDRASTINTSSIRDPATSIQSMSTQSPQQSQLSQSNGIDTFGGLFSPSVLAATADPNGHYFGFDVNGTNVFTQYQDTSRTGVEIAQSAVPGLYFGSSASNTESPGSSHGSQQQHSTSASPNTAFTSPTSRLQDLGLNAIPTQPNPTTTNPIWNGKEWEYEIIMDYKTDFPQQIPISPPAST